MTQRPARGTGLDAVGPPEPGASRVPVADPGPARRVLCVFPRYAKSFGTLDHAFPLVGATAFMPPQGILTIAAYLPAGWSVRFVDENVRPVADADLAWAEVVFLTGMHVQRAGVEELTDRAHQAGALVALGGPSVSACPELYPGPDLLHVGELGDATAALIARLADDVSRPAAQEAYRTVERLELADCPPPAYHLIDLDDYLLASVQFSSGCPFRCEFCDIPALYGRRPRMKTVGQVTAELDAMLAVGDPGTVYFVDDNFIADPHAALSLLHGLVDWQRRRGYPLSFACEATMNLAQRTDVLELMREASFVQVFVGVESPSTSALQLIKKQQNLRRPVLDAIGTINDHGLEVVAGIILGLDTDDAATVPDLLAFVAASHVPMLTINLLHALPRTALWDRLVAEGRLLDDPGDRESNVDFLRPYDEVVAGWRDVVLEVFTPDALYARFAHQLERTYPNRRPRPQRPVTRADLRRGLSVLTRIGWHVGVRSDYRRAFWRMALPLLRQGRVEKVVHFATVTHHLVTFAREVAAGTADKCFYNPAGARPLTGGLPVVPG
ncbi:B12-binding domain-containing radical SAM protein [Modestobacter sp. VKM Ac-2983]|uniref:B12-binding domain-containing radical SAM protein n=1 Tax=Modestobacter sp. VKM Ac-2983 TaxID=3004137 RepID=UPI0022ABB28E|nr:B12-binding domain-containing radical SAM protein [Modestobacter sp. VKM Ac-2983]MCZ2805419.1 B12-binding domain-containing radical SAM protein [Modestobacter sp. VKM Ac-2983]